MDEEAVLGVAMMLMGENSHAVAERVAEKVGPNSKASAGGCCHQSRNTTEKSGPPNDSHRRHESFRRSVACYSSSAFSARKLARCFDRRDSHSAGIPFRNHRNGAIRISGNLMSLGAIDFGLIIDGAVVIVENIVRQLGRDSTSLDARLTIEERSTQVGRREQAGRQANVLWRVDHRYRLPADSGALWDRRKNVSPDGADSDAGARRLVGAGLNANAGALLILLQGPISRNATTASFARLRASTHPFCVFRCDCAGSSYSAPWRFFVVALFIFTRLGADFIPKLDEGAFTMMVFRPSSINLDRSIEEQRRTEQEIKKRVPEITHVFSRIGSAEIATDPMPPSDCDFYIYYKPRSQWRKIDNRPISKDDLAKIITKEIEALNPGARVMVAQPVEMRFNEMLEGIRADIAVKIFGE